MTKWGVYIHNWVLRYHLSMYMTDISIYMTYMIDELFDRWVISRVITPPHESLSWLMTHDSWEWLMRSESWAWVMSHELWVMSKTTHHWWIMTDISIYMTDHWKETRWRRVLRYTALSGSPNILCSANSLSANREGERDVTLRERDVKNRDHSSKSSRDHQWWLRACVRVNCVCVCVYLSLSLSLSTKTTHVQIISDDLWFL